MKKPTIISIVSEKGGVGKTTTAYNLAGALTLQDRKVCLIDLDSQQNLAQNFWEDEDNNPTFAELIYNTVSKVKILSDNSIKDIVRHKAYSKRGLRLKAYGKRRKCIIDYLPCNKEMLNTLTIMLDKNIYAVKETLDNEIFSKYDVIIIDCKNNLGGSLVPQALAASDYTIIVTECSQYSFYGVGNTIDYINSLADKYELPLKVGGVLINKSPSRMTVGEMVKEALDEGYSDIVFKTIIPYRLSQTENAIKEQKPCVFKKSNTLGSFYMALADEVIERIGG